MTPLLIFCRGIAAFLRTLFTEKKNKTYLPAAFDVTCRHTFTLPAFRYLLKEMEIVMNTEFRASLTSQVHKWMVSNLHNNLFRLRFAFAKIAFLPLNDFKLNITSKTR